MKGEIGAFQLWAVLLFLAGTVLWCGFASAWTLAAFVAFASVAAMSFAGGCAAGFVFSTYDEEAQSVGKVKDWILGALTGVAITELAKGGREIHRFFEQFKPEKGSANSVAVMIAIAVAEFIAGFFLMYFNRELLLNPMLHKKRQELKKLVVEAAPALKAADEEAPVTKKAEARADVAPAKDSESVEKLIEYVESNRLQPEDLSTPILTKVANAYYHVGQYAKAIPFFRRALVVSPQDAGAGLKLMVALGELGRYNEAVQIGRMLEERKLGIPLVYKLLGYYALWVDELLDDAVRYGSDYVRLVPKDSGGFFNLACAYAQLYGLRHRPEDRTRALENLEKAVSMDSGWKTRALELTKNDSFSSLANDPEFQPIVSGG